jgi:hypothetical protein
MTNKLILSALAAAATLAVAGSAQACPAGYEAVWIQGNKVCKFAGVGGNGNLSANPQPGVNAVAASSKLQSNNSAKKQKIKRQH